MPTIARCVDIAVSAEQAFEFIAEVSNLPKFHEGISDLHLLSDKDRGLGIEFGCSVDIPRKGTLDCTYEITDFIDYILITIKTTSGPKSEGIMAFCAHGRDEHQDTHHLYTHLSGASAHHRQSD